LKKKKAYLFSITLFENYMRLLMLLIYRIGSGEGEIKTLVEVCLQSQECISAMVYTCLVSVQVSNTSLSRDNWSPCTLHSVFAG
jgi:hypothetical protein